MRFALIADVHANREALEAVLEHAQAQGCERHVFLGDYVGYGADPQWVLERIRALVANGAIAVKGNHDAGVAGVAPQQMVNAARHVVTWTRAQIQPDELRFLQDLPLQVTEGESLFVHANAFAPERWAYVLNTADALRSLRATACTYTFCGHVHEPRLFGQGGPNRCIDFVPDSDRPVPLPGHRRWLILPGSTGQPRDGNPAACYASFDGTQRTLCFHRVPYDHDGAAAKIRAAGLPDVLAARLADGR